MRARRSSPHTPGLRVVCPRNALDANGLLRTAIRCDDPVLFLEHKHLYRQTYNKSPYPGPDFMIPFGKARVVREGSDVTVVTYGATVLPRAPGRAPGGGGAGISVEILDLRTLSPVDWEAIAVSARKTSKVLVAHRGLAFLRLRRRARRPHRRDALRPSSTRPVRRLAATDTFVPYAPELEDFVLPQVADILKAVRELAAW